MKGIVLIVEGSCGIGKAAAIAAAKAGFKIHITGKNTTALSTARADIINAALVGESTVQHSSVDMASLEGLQTFSKQFTAGSLQHLIVSSCDQTSEFPTILSPNGLLGLRRLFDVKFFAQLGAVSCLAPLLADGGSVILTSGALTRNQDAPGASKLKRASRSQT